MKSNQKKVNIIGYGVVGSAQNYLLRKLGHEVYIYTTRACFQK